MYVNHIISDDVLNADGWGDEMGDGMGRRGEGNGRIGWGIGITTSHTLTLTIATTPTFLHRRVFLGQNVEVCSERLVEADLAELGGDVIGDSVGGDQT